MATTHTSNTTMKWMTQAFVSELTPSPEDSLPNFYASPTSLSPEN